MSAAVRSYRSLLLRILLRGLSATWRYRESVPPDCLPLVRGEARGVIAFWHGKMLPVWYRFGRSGAGALVSMSKDGALLADYLERGLGYERVIRGSSSRGGGEALRALVDLLGERSCLITPDGPRGPACRAKAGALIGASRAGVPVMGVGWHASHVHRLRSWDGMEIPYPFARIYIRYCRFNSFMAREGAEGKDTSHETGRHVDDETRGGAGMETGEGVGRGAGRGAREEIGREADSESGDSVRSRADHEMRGRKADGGTGREANGETDNEPNGRAAGEMWDVKAGSETSREASGENHDKPSSRPADEMRGAEAIGGANDESERDLRGKASVEMRSMEADSGTGNTNYGESSRGAAGEMNNMEADNEINGNAGGKAGWIGQETLNRFDRMLNALNSPTYREGTR